WSDAEEMPGIASLNLGDYAEVTSLSCGSAGNCTVGGYYSSVSGEADFNHAAFVDDETDGTWQPAQQVRGTAVTPPNAQVSSVSCVSASYCAASGSDPDGGFVITRSTLQQTTTALTLSAATVTYGDEQTERVSVRVSPHTSGSPTGTVTVKHGSATVCTITLASAAGSCAVPATKLGAGKPTVTAVYEGNSDFGPSSSAAKTLTVAKATSKASLTLSAAKVTYGHEGSEHLSVQVTPRYSGAPGGTVKVKSGSSTVCVITLKSGKGSCRLTAKKLKAGTYHLVASYGGNADFTGGNSGAKTLTVVK
ncbi:MAG TPA: Ig-like domain-containing protein, partial [Streptosporangiaceae bacterium]|nr:Ig-like domain-containing protein [Streptosporangiaceae bacterium]